MVLNELRPHLVSDQGMNHRFSSEITRRADYENRVDRRQCLVALLGGAMTSVSASAVAQENPAQNPTLGSRNVPRAGRLAPLSTVPSEIPGGWTSDKLTPYEDITTYNNYYEFSTNKSEPAKLARDFKPRPWTLIIDGEVEKPQQFSLEDLLKRAPLEDRIYRLRCVEGWSMVIPWVGYSLATLLTTVGPNSRAKYVTFISLADPKTMPGVSSDVLQWPYMESLRIDEAMHPLTMIAFGLYGEVLSNQNGAPLRLVVPWKYGFKSAKAVVHISVTENPAVPSWVRYNPHEYGYYSNVNPDVDHPRWSQASERRIGEGGIFAPKRPTLKFNGYGDQVASLYAGMDLVKNF